MKTNSAKCLSLIMFIVSLLITLFLLVCAIAGIFVLQAVPPVVVMFLFTAYLLWVDTVYLRSYQCLRNPDAQGPISTGLRMQCTVLTALMGGAAATAWLVLSGAAVLFGPAVLANILSSFLLYFLIIGIISTVYVVNTLLILRAMHGKKG